MQSSFTMLTSIPPQTARPKPPANPHPKTNPSSRGPKLYQAEDRVHRIGQPKDVRIFKLVAKDTVDAGIFAVAERKRRLEAQLLGEGGEGDGKNTAAPAAEIGEIISGVVARASTGT